MIIDHEAKKSNNNKIVEVLIVDTGISIWMPAMATDLRIMNKNRELVKVKEIRVRNLEEEKNE